MVYTPVDITPEKLQTSFNDILRHLPIKVGDAVRLEGEDFAREVTQITITGHLIDIEVDDYDSYTLSDFGKQIFLLKEKYSG